MEHSWPWLWGTEAASCPTRDLPSTLRLHDRMGDLHQCIQSSSNCLYGCLYSPEDCLCRWVLLQQEANHMQHTVESATSSGNRTNRGPREPFRETSASLRGLLFTSFS